MPKRQTKAEDIRDPWHYFNRYISKEILQDQKKQAEYYKMFASLDELLSEETAGLSRRTQMLRPQILTEQALSGSYQRCHPSHG